MDREKLLMEIDDSGRHKGKERTTSSSQQVLHPRTGMETLQGDNTKEVLERTQNIYGGTIRIYRRDLQEQPRTHSTLAFDSIHKHRTKK